mmetsp:Transcript_66749/g.98982  ORF Transcript_66749/g.98982 Transcript_66749/m.98982 type:complete len:309 (-) Transcript_66749:1449-2375(-)
MPSDPSIHQLRSAIAAYCILPLGSSSIKANIDDSENVRSVLFYGPSGAGKTSMAEAVASELGALFINLSPRCIAGKFDGKGGTTKLIHMAFTVAKDPAFAPVVIYIDECESFFQSTKKKKKGPVVDKNGPVKFQKDLMIYKNQSLKKEDRVLIIGCSNKPELADAKLLKWKGQSGKPEKQGFFERFLYFPPLQYADRVPLWSKFISQQMKEIGFCISKLPTLDFTVLAHFSEGFTAGALKNCVASALPLLRVQAIESKPISEGEIIGHLKAKEDDTERFSIFTSIITDLDTRRKQLDSTINKGNGAKK